MLSYAYTPNPYEVSMSMSMSQSPVVVASLPLTIAKAMKPILPKDGSLAQILCEAGPDLGRERTARYVCTNGHVLLVVDTNLPAPTEAQLFSNERFRDTDTGRWRPTTVELVVSSKGHYEPEYSRAQDAGTFPDYAQVIPSSAVCTAVERIGLNVAYVDLALKIHKALKLGAGTGGAHWSVAFHGPLSPTVWEPMDCGEAGYTADWPNLGITRVQFVVMPVRLY